MNGSPRAQNENVFAALGRGVVVLPQGLEQGGPAAVPHVVHDPLEEDRIPRPLLAGTRGGLRREDAGLLLEVLVREDAGA